MVLPLIPLAIVGAGALVGVGVAFSGDETTNTSYQTSVQNTYTTTSFKFYDKVEGLDLDFRQTISPSVEQVSEQKGSSSLFDSKTLLLIGGGLVGFYLIKEKL